MHDVIYMPVEQILRPVQAQIFRDDADVVLPEQRVIVKLVLEGRQPLDEIFILRY